MIEQGTLTFTVEKKKKSERNATDYNGWLCEMAAVIPQKGQCIIAREHPAASVGEAATSQSRLDVTCKRGTAQWDNKVEN
jgi:hypothetical protein